MFVCWAVISLESNIFPHGWLSPPPKKRVNIFIFFSWLHAIICFSALFECQERGMLGPKKWQIRAMGISTWSQILFMESIIFTLHVWCCIIDHWIVILIQINGLLYPKCTTRTQTRCMLLKCFWIYVLLLVISVLITCHVYVCRRCRWKQWWGHPADYYHHPCWWPLWDLQDDWKSGSGVDFTLWDYKTPLYYLLLQSSPPSCM